MLAYLPFLISVNSLGVICLIIFLASLIVFTIPVFATRGSTQLAWTGVVAFFLLAELAIMVTLVVLVSQGEIWQG